MSKEAMKLALEALENSRSLEPVDVQWVKGKRHAAIAALREALAEQPAQQEPFGFAVMENPIAPPTQQEPVGYVAENGVVDWNICAPPIMTDLYTAPPVQRTWVGLTKDEVFAVSNTMPYGDRFDFAEAIEAKLKEKNNG